MQKIRKILKFLFLTWVIIGIYFLLQIPTTADWGDFDSYDSSSSYDDWGSSSSDSWSSSSSDWGSSWDDDDYGSSSSSGGSVIFFGGGGGAVGKFYAILFGICLFVLVINYINRKNNERFYGRNTHTRGFRDMMRGPRNTGISPEIIQRRIKNRETLFGVSDVNIEDSIQAEDPLFNKAEFLAWAGDMFVKLQYAWSDRNLEEIRHFVTPELYEQTNNQVQRYIINKQINKLERVSVNLSRLYSYDKQGDREILRIVLESKMNDYIINETTGAVVKGDPNEEHVNPYILTFIRKAGVKTEAGEIKPVTMNCPNCGGATTILSSGKCPYCGSIITTRDNKWTLSSMKRYNPNA